MDKRYKQYCLASLTCYDSPCSGHVRAQDDVQDGSSAVSSFALPQKGRSTRLGDWMINADQTLTKIRHYCVPALMRNAEYAPRGSSGKVVTIFPADDEACEHMLANLDELLVRRAGPHDDTGY